MLEKCNCNIKDKVKFNIQDEPLTGIITSISPNGKIVRVRVIKHGRRCWHEWLKVNQIKLMGD
ncbi:MAG: hypothetical protein KH415_09545 [Clostridium sp.]|nr:hypothetical protein [Clostridium sp.]